MRGLPSCIVLLSATLAGGVCAQDAEFLSVERAPGAEDCPDAPSLEARIAAIRGRGGGPIHTSYDVGFSRTADAFSAVIRSGANGESQRVLEGHGLSCTALAQATAVTLALLFDSEPDASPMPKPEPPQRLSPKPNDSPSTPLAIEGHSTGARVDSTFSLGAAGLVGVLRPIAPAFTGEVGLAVARWRMGIGVLWNPTQSLAVDPGTVRESLLAGTARSCIALTRHNGSRFDVCTGLFAGVVTAEGQGFTHNDRRVRTWLAVPLELSWAQLSGPVGWELSASALGSLVRQDFSIDGLGTAYRSPGVGGMLSLRVVGVVPW